MRTATTLFAGLMFATACASYAQAQDTPSPPQPKRPTAEEAQKSMETAMGAMLPMMNKMTEAMIDAQLRIAERPETAERIATFKRNLFEALQKRGFTTSQAMQITLSTSPPSASSVGK